LRRGFFASFFPLLDSLQMTMVPRPARRLQHWLAAASTEYAVIPLVKILDQSPDCIQSAEIGWWQN
jgi:hypothetical protein